MARRSLSLHAARLGILLGILCSAPAQSNHSLVVAADKGVSGQPSVSGFVAERLRSSLAQVPELATARILSAATSSDGVVRLYGLLGDPSQRALIEAAGLKALQSEAANPRSTLKGPFAKVDASWMFVMGRERPFPLDFIVTVDKMLDAMSSGVLRVQSYDVGTREITLCGFVASPTELQELQVGLQSFTEVSLVRIEPVILTDEKAFDGTYSWMYVGMFDDVRTQHGQNLVAVSSAMIRKDHRRSAVWYVRAAGHLLCGQRSSAVGDVRIAVALDRRVHYGGASPRSQVLERFQGRLRVELEQIVASGTLASVTY